jgi:hypothetical protein
MPVKSRSTAVTSRIGFIITPSLIWFFQTVLAKWFNLVCYDMTLFFAISHFIVKSLLNNVQNSNPAGEEHVPPMGSQPSSEGGASPV